MALVSCLAIIKVMPTRGKNLKRSAFVWEESFNCWLLSQNCSYYYHKKTREKAFSNPRVMWVKCNCKNRILIENFEQRKINHTLLLGACWKMSDTVCSLLQFSILSRRFLCKETIIRDLYQEAFLPLEREVHAYSTLESARHVLRPQ